MNDKVGEHRAPPEVRGVRRRRRMAGLAGIAALMFVVLLAGDALLNRSADEQTLDQSGATTQTGTIIQTKTAHTVDSNGVFSSLALAGSGNPVIAYRDPRTDDLKVAACQDAVCSSGNVTVSTVDSEGSVGFNASLALDSAGNPVISYFDKTNRDLKLAVCADASCSAGNISINTVASEGDVGLDSSLALDDSGNPVIAFGDRSNGDLKLVVCGDPVCSAAHVTISDVATSGFVGNDSSLVLDNSGNPVISYFDESNQTLQIAVCGDAVCSPGSAVLNTVDAAPFVGVDTSLVLDRSGNPVISHFDVTNQDVKVAVCTDAVCTPGSVHLNRIVTEGFVGTDSSLALDAAGHPVIAFHDRTNGDLMVAWCGDASCSPNSVTLKAVDTAGNVGGAPSMTLDASSNPVISYQDVTNGGFKVLVCADPRCEKEDG